MKKINSKLLSIFLCFTLLLSNIPLTFGISFESNGNILESSYEGKSSGEIESYESNDLVSHLEQGT